MANTKSAIKTIRRISRQTQVNKSRKSRFKNAFLNLLFLDLFTWVCLEILLIVLIADLVFAIFRWRYNHRFKCGQLFNLLFLTYITIKN